MLSTIAKENHLWERVVMPFKSPPYQFQKTGINEVFSFNCFCNTHDTKLFYKIEKKDINFEDYESRLLFIVRTYYNELFKKMVAIDQFNCLKDKTEDEFKKDKYQQTILQSQLSIKDLEFIENLIWLDLNSKSESFVLNYRLLDKEDLILSSFYDFETTFELGVYKLQNKGKDIERHTPVFITLFPYKDKSVLLMGYIKEDENKVKGYFNQFFNESEKRVQRKITNLMLFQCENWVCSDAFYKKKIKGKEGIFANAAYFSGGNIYERKVFDLNIFHETFREKLEKWNNEYGKHYTSRYS